VAKLRLGNEMRKGRYWGMRRRGNAGYAGELESWEHIWEKCERWRKGTDVSCLVRGI